MTDPTERFEPRSSDVAAKVIDGEAVMIDLSTGVYYSITGSGEVWTAIEGGFNAVEIASEIARTSNVGAEEVQRDVVDLIDRLIRENIITRSDKAPVKNRQSLLPTNGQPYRKPELQIYRDMDDLLALDPPMPALTDIPWQGAGGQKNDSDAN